MAGSAQRRDCPRIEMNGSNHDRGESGRKEKAVACGKVSEPAGIERRCFGSTSPFFFDVQKTKGLD